MSDQAEIYVKLEDEGVDVWRPVRAEHIEGDTYRILPQPYDRDTERWAFEPGSAVVCEFVDDEDGRFLAAVRELGGS